MSQSRAEIDPELVVELVLVRLFVNVKGGVSRNQAVKGVANVLSPPLSESDARGAATAALDECARRKLVDLAPRRVTRAKVGRIGPPQLTAEGERAARAALGGEGRARPRDWSQAKKVLAFRRIEATASDHGAITVEALKARAIALHHALPGTPKTVAAAVDQLAWRALGRNDASERFTIGAVQRYLLREIVPRDARVKDIDAFRDMVALHAAGANRTGSHALTHGLLCRPRAANDRPGVRAAREVAMTRAKDHFARVQNSNDASPQPQPSLADFARAVHEAAKGPGVARFHDDRAFIGSIWENMRGQSPVGDMSLDEFKTRLVNAHRQRLLRITRADLVGAMDPLEVERSEARYQDATFHFVALDAGGTR